MTSSLDEFTNEARQFLEAWPVRAEKKADFTWGDGSDDVSIFDEVDPDKDQARLEDVRAWRRQLDTAGLAWIDGPPEYGGRGLSRQHQQAFDALARTRDVPGNSRLTVSLGMIAPTILAHATETAKQRYLHALYRGDLVACQLFSEPEAGSDLASVGTKAERDGDGWRITGQKVWTSGAHLADIGEVLARTSDEGRHRNLTAFIVDMRAAGVEVRPLRQMTGGASFNEVFFDDVWVPDDDRLGDVDGGWRVAMTTLLNERGAIGGSGFGGKGLLSVDRLIVLAREMGRVADPVVRQEIARLVCGLRTASWTRQRFAANGVRGSESSMLKCPGWTAVATSSASSMCSRRTMSSGPSVLGSTMPSGAPPTTAARSVRAASS